MLTGNWRESLILYKHRLDSFNNYEEIVDWFIPWMEKHFGLNNIITVYYKELQNLKKADDFFNGITKPEHNEMDGFHSYHLYNHHKGEKFEVLKKYIALDQRLDGIQFMFEAKPGNIFEEGESLSLELRAQPQESQLRFQLMKPSELRILQLNDALGIRLKYVGHAWP